MRKVLPMLLSAMSIMAMAPSVAAAHAPQPVNPPADLPDGIVSVSPVQGFVDVSGSVSPNGVSVIGLNFNKNVLVNEANTEPAILYHNDFEVPAATTLVTSVDQMVPINGGVLFKDRIWTAAGVYKVEIPAGMFLYEACTNAEGESYGTDPTPAVTLYYEIYKGYSLSPSSGTYEKLSVAWLNFTDADEVVANSPARSIEFYMDNSLENFMAEYEIIPASGDEKCKVKLSLGANGQYGNVTAPGIYGLLIPAGAFTYRTYGANHATDPEDYVERKNDEILVKYTVPKYPALEIDPDPDFTVKEFDSFSLYIPDGFTLWFADNMTQSNLYRVDEDGNVDTSKVYVYAKAAPYTQGDSFVKLNIYDPATHELLESYTPEESGRYCLRLSSQVLFGEWSAALTGGEPEIGGSDAYDYFYTVIGKTTGVDCDAVVAGEDAHAAGVYNINGLRVADKADASTMSGLPKGIYISNGRKVIN